MTCHHVIIIRHGDMLYMAVQDTQNRSYEADKQYNNITEDSIDITLRKKDGKIYRKRDPQL